MLIFFIYIYLKFFFFFLEEASYAHQGYIYFTLYYYCKNSNIVKYYYN